MLETRLFSNQSIILPSFSSHKSIVKSDKFCKKLNLCQEVTALTSEFHLGNCEAWRETVTKLKDPETKLKLRISLKGSLVSRDISSCKELLTKGFKMKKCLAAKKI
ncbi:unnamed protein product [Arabidopsis thaliana]|uniref:Uncharacterized protein n=1 Tax=Arabidopsis thaliana TaxID=3702 RepID=A0A654FB75_ARATH|nr:unnamed protein product [Arabidopsis thaliana]VYS58769.1 unnamed protein product [Arabidopsis thaliana]